MDKKPLNNQSQSNNANMQTTKNPDNTFINDILNQAEIQRQNIIELKLKLKAKQTELEEKQKQLALETKHSKDLEQQLNNIFSEVEEGDNIKDNYFKLRNENEKLKTQIKINKCFKKNELAELNSKLNNELETSKNQLVQMKRQHEELKNKKNIEFEEYKKNDYNEEFIDKQLETFYDVIVNIKSIASLSKEEGWPIKWNINRKDSISKLKDENLLKVGILGNGNVGKSFLLSRLFHMKIPSGYSVITEGLSLKYNEDDKYTILDSAGLQTPLLAEEKYEDKDEEKNRKKYEDLYKDKTQTENFIQNLIIYLSDMILIVVGKITFNEQKLINKIKKELEENETLKDNRIFIIHNLMNFQKKNQVEKHIETNLMKSASFSLRLIPYVSITTNKDNNIPEEEKRYCFVEKENKGIKVYHLIMAREHTEAGDYYNPFAYKLLREQFNTFTIRRIIGTSLQDCRVKFHDRDWQDIKDCDQTDFDPGWSGGDVSSDLNIDYNLGDKIFVWIKVFNKLPENYENYCCIYFNLFINEYYINNNLDYIYYCSNCDCTDSLGEKTFCHKWGDKRLYCTPVRGKEYQFYFMINGYNELNLMYAATELTDYFLLILY